MNKVEVGVFLRLFNRHGYVLDFSTSSFDAFTLDSVGDAICQKASSKEKWLRKIS